MTDSAMMNSRSPTSSSIDLPAEGLPGLAQLPQAWPSAVGESQRFKSAGVEPSLTEVLRDPIVRLLMERDRVDESELCGYLQDMRKSDACRSAA